MSRILALLAVAAAMLSGCASVPLAGSDLDARAKQFTAEPGRAAVYIYRNENFGGAIPMTVSVNGKTIGQTAAKTFFLLGVAPGRYTIESHAENVSSLPLSVEPGRNYFVWQEVKMGLWMARSLLQQVDDQTGRTGVLESKLIASSVSGDDLRPLDAASAAPSGDAVSQRLRELQNLRRDGVITEQEFEAKKRELLEKF